MPRTLFSAMAVFAFSFAMPATSSANDIVDFLRSISGPSQTHHRHANVRSADRGRHDHDHRTKVIPVSSRRSPGRDIHRHDDHRRDDHGRHGIRHDFDRRSPSRYRSSRPISIRRPGVSFSVSLGSNVVPPPPVIAVPAGPTFGSFAHLPHPIGSIVTCPVPIETCVRIKGVRRIAPGAIPVVVAVRSPHIGQHGSCVEEVAYVEVLVPPCPLRGAKVSRCGTKIRLDYGGHDINIVSRDGLVEINY
ncbi:hypothetical protein [Fuerstiella marisgermanici]|uniref:Uncharacterized protein n=1 Tax=Fuerstiella marisgermanici TaxID=1891926 RepID=A0A1P8WJG2_9PLAN|nr:hypothetical protein [Fuerstiella marisgermanici]APZ94193.1 hypothetical protein Fuma_03817 [Fuerstiella marisgermanici]